VPLSWATSYLGRDRRALILAYLSMGWMVIEAALAVTAGILATSIALVGFGLDSVIEFFSVVSQDQGGCVPALLRPAQLRRELSTGLAVLYVPARSSKITRSLCHLAADMDNSLRASAPTGRARLSL